MAATDFVVTLSGGAETSPFRTYRPGEQLRGVVNLFVDQNLKCKHFYIRLGWHTEGRGTRHSEKLDELDIFQGELSSSIPASHDFTFYLPDQPWSYEGHYISIVWGLEFEIDVPWGKNLKHFEPFILQPQRQTETEWT